MGSKDQEFMVRALEQARQSAEQGEVPVGAVLVSGDGQVLAEAGNATVGPSDPAGHAEIRVLREAARKTGNYRLTGTVLYVTLEPCAMCAGAISHARVARLVFAAADEKGGAVLHGPEFFQQPTCHFRPDVVHGMMAKEAGEMLRTFFRARRTNKISLWRNE